MLSVDVLRIYPKRKQSDSKTERSELKKNKNKPTEKYIKQLEVEKDIYWTELLTILTEDDNLRLRKNDFDKLKATEIREFLIMLKTFEARLEEKKNNLKQQK